MGEFWETGEGWITTRQTSLHPVGRSVWTAATGYSTCYKTSDLCI